MRKAQLIRLAASGQADRFITITCRRDEFRTPNEAAAALAAAWRRFVLHWRRRNKGQSCEYLCVVEAHKSGWPHLHILWRGPWVAWSYLKAEMTALLGSPHVHIKRIFKSSSYAAYVAKYIGKAAHKFGTTKRYWASKHYELKHPTDARKVFPKISAEHRRNISTSDLVREWKHHGRLVYRIGADVWAWGDPWWRGNRPPHQVKTRIEYVAGEPEHVADLPESFDPLDG